MQSKKSFISQNVKIPLNQIKVFIIFLRNIVEKHFVQLVIKLTLFLERPYGLDSWIFFCAIT